MSPSPVVDAQLRFDDFEVDPLQGTVRRKGTLIPLQEKPLKLLLALLEKPGQVVSREELRNRLWPGDEFGAFEDGLNTAVRKLRIALEDSAENPRFIETVPKRGYRFAVPVSLVPTSATIGATEIPAVPQRGIEISAKSSARRKIIFGAGAAILLLVVGIGLAYKWRAFRDSSREHQISSLAVLPLTNLTGDQSQNYLVDAMTDELTTSLAQTSGLRITSETSATQYRGTTKPLRQIAAELGVDAIVEGSVTRLGNEIRVTAQLIDAKTDRHLWAQSYEREAADLLRLQRELALDIAGQVSARVAVPGSTRQGTGTTHAEAFEAYARGRSHVEKWTIEGSGEGLKYFQRAIEIDPGFALAYVGEAECYRFGIPGVSRRDSLDLAMDASERALALQPDMGEAHAAVGYLLWLRDWKFREAEAELKRGIALNPNYAPAHHWYAHLLMDLGRFDEAFQESRKLLELDPVSPAANLHLGNHYLASRQWDLAIEQEKKTLQMEPDYIEAHRQLAEAYLGKKMYEEAETEMQRAADLSGSKSDYPLYPALLGNIFGQAGNSRRAQKILSGVKAANQPQLESYVYAGLGNREKSIEMLNEAYRRRSISLELGFLPEFDRLRSDPEFEELMRKIGLL